MYYSMDQIISKNKKIGHIWFSPDTMAFFHTRLSRKIYGGEYFVTSEKFDSYKERLYTVRKAMPDGSIETVGPFNEMTSKQAHKMAKELAEPSG